MNAAVFSEWFSLSFAFFVGVSAGLAIVFGTIGTGLFLWRLMKELINLIAAGSNALHRYAHREYITEISVDHYNRDTIMRVRGLRGLEDLVKLGGRVSVRKEAPR